MLLFCLIRKELRLLVGCDAGKVVWMCLWATECVLRGAVTRLRGDADPEE